ncbi:Holliday junction resolvase RuvX [Heliorestis acidaminivorans]|uniref:Putative pre-16S rRNA nuclease n=1 Tax=Heliorestis acidaminivorans TaxID=553427 RepID=A0A6I0ENG4_9FIRM|nr:Holliday junction resolvase RuvX [Heliorestis acidaminivorans]KAB2951282.1 Holliday junction resolvase RuvX [Heliorestis acidaminivorans]
MRILGLDVGDKRIGIAISDPMGWTAQGIETLKRQSKEKDLARLVELIHTYEVDTIVCGLPRNMNGTYGPKAEETRRFGDKLQEHFQIPLIYWDERLTTVSAQKTLLQGDVSRAKRKEVVDKIAAVFILQNYLDARAKS